MKRRTFFVAAVAAALAIPSVAAGQATRTWVSGVGDDVNPCSRTAPCKTFAGAISKTASGGIITVLDPGGFGTVTITKPITLVGMPGVDEILFSSVNGIVINYTNPSPRPVVLREIDLSGAGTTLGVDGIRFLNGSQLRLQNVTIDSLSGDGIEVATNGRVYATNLEINDAGVGLRFNAGGGRGGTFKNTEITGGTYGVIANGGSTNLTLNDCVVANQSQGGLYASGARMQVNGCEVRDNNIGIWAEFSALARVSDTTIINNNTGVFTTTGGSILSRGNNTLEDNGGGNTFSGLYGPK